LRRSHRGLLSQSSSTPPWYALIVGEPTSTDPPNPEPLLWRGLGLAVFAWIVTTFAAPNFEPLKFIAPQSSTSGGLAVLFLGAIISIRIYDHVNRKAEKRQLRHEFALSRVKEIYVPFWDETAALLELAQAYDRAELEYGTEEQKEIAKKGYAVLMKGPLRLFVDSQLQSLLVPFHKAVASYKDAWQRAHDDLPEQAQRLATALTGQPASGGPTRQISDLLVTNNTLIWGAPRIDERWEQNLRDRFREAFAQVPQPPHGNDADAALAGVRGLLRVRPLAETMRQASRVCVEAGERVIERLEGILRDPTSVVLEFD